LISRSIRARSARANSFSRCPSRTTNAPGSTEPSADAHGFIAPALAREQSPQSRDATTLPATKKLQTLNDRLLLVDDAIAALQTLARKVYEQWGHPVVGITGSAGKTTTKELTAHVLAGTGRRILKSERNYNNGLGLPLSVLQMVSRGRDPKIMIWPYSRWECPRPRTRFDRLVQITPPDIGVELLVAPVHLEHLGTIENVAAMRPS